MSNNVNYKILALSSSRAGDSAYLATAKPFVEQLIGKAALNIAFVPFAMADKQYDNYLNNVKASLQEFPYTIHLVTEADAVEIIKAADVIMVGGGNTFCLLKRLQQTGALKAIQTKVQGGTPYIGWSAGANILAPTICTTNDMPIVQPDNFEALNLLPFQINPHYTNEHLPGHRGETRDDRLSEFCLVNTNMPVVGLPEGTAILLSDGTISYQGNIPACVFRYSNGEPQKRSIEGGTLLNDLTKA